MNEIQEGDAAEFLIRGLRERRGFRQYGYEVYVPSVIMGFLADQGITGFDAERARDQISPAFLAAAWGLCRRGILRPGVIALNHQATAEGNAGSGFSVTPFGRTWLAEAERDDYVPTEPGRFAQMLAEHEGRFDPAFHERAQEAIRCYGAHAYLACCAMCGAAAETIILSAAIARASGDAETVLRTYNSGGGRGRIEASLLGQAPEWLRREFQGFAALLKYWRDEAAHGAASGITDDEAYTSLAYLLRFAKYADNNWEVLTGGGLSGKGPRLQ